MTKDELITKIQKLKPAIEKEYGISQLALFGSYARNEQNSQSDIDLLVWAADKNYFTLLDLQTELTIKLGHSIDIGYYDSLKSYVKESIQKDLCIV